MENNKPDSTLSQSNKRIVLACSGGSDLGELSDKVARRLKDKKNFNIKCLAMVAAHDKTLIETLQSTDSLVIDGCNIDCGKKIMEEAWLSGYRYIRLTDMGYLKGQTPVTDDLIEKIFSQIVNSEGGDKIVRNKPSSHNNCCT